MSDRHRLDYLGNDRGPPREAGGEPSDDSARGEDERPPPRRNYALAIGMALIVFALLIGFRVLGDLSGGPTAPTMEPAPDAPADTQN